MAGSERGSPRDAARSWDVEVRITPREGILDPEGETIARALGNLGYEGVSRVRAGRLVRLQLVAESRESARAAVERMCEELIANPIIEDYAVAVRNGGEGHGGRGGEGPAAEPADREGSEAGDGGGA